MKDYYEILEINEHASKEIIEKAYKVLAKKNHPDLYVGQLRRDAELKLREINEAYKILSNEFLKEQYDKERQKFKREQYIKERVKKTENQRNMDKIKKDTKERPLINKKNAKSGSFAQGIELLNIIFKNRPKKINIKGLKKEDWIAIGMTIAILIILGIILWFIPFTNSWIRELTIENPLFSWIGNIFSK